MSPVEACRGCARLYPFLPRGLCAECLDRREADFRTVRDWLRENAGASILAASRATEVDEARIAEFVREGRLEMVGGGPSAEEARAEDERRSRLVREIASKPTLGTSVSAQEAAPGRPGMRTRSL